MATPLLLAAVLSLGLAPDDNWPQFRGPRGDGRADKADLPTHWSETENVRWKTPIHGKAWSSPVVWGERIWLTTATEDGKVLSALALDRRTGKILIDREVFHIAKPAFCHPKNSYASSTPCLEEGRVYVHFGSAGTACLDAATGDTLWSRQDFPCDHWRGPASSPVLHDGLLFLTFDGADLQYVAALDAKTGKTVWKKDRDINYGTSNGDVKKAYSTPTVIKVAGREQLVSPAATATIAYDPKSGEEIWKVYHGGMNGAPPPLSGLGRLFLCTGDGGARLLAVRPDGSGDVTRSHVDWKYGTAIPTKSSPVLVGDLLFTASELGFVNCLDAKTGTPVWKEQRLPDAAIWASPIYASGRLYCFGDEGKSFVIEAGREWKVLATNRLDDGCMASPAVAGNSLILRTKTHLYCIEKKE